ncbi:hypothetical protein LZC95_50720 [Pendulispora brunnea]|uniref:NHL repeat-containing protein n=1 Tax=Pendulispora brunnea TaxID=2905690 RepID=A0ABZ2K7L9_9BACT
MTSTPTRIAMAAMAVCSLAAPACRDEVSLGNPRPLEIPPSLLPACPEGDELETLAEVAIEYGPIRAMKADSGDLFVVAARDKLPGTLLHLTNGSLQFVATVGVGPAAIALDRNTVLVACSESSQVFRVARNGTTTLFVANQPGVRAVVAAESGDMAYWVLTGDTGAVRQYYFGSSSFYTRENVEPPVSIANDGKSIYISGAQGPVIKGIGSFSDPSIRLPGRCDGRMLVLTEQDLLCVDGNAINRIPRDELRAATTRAVLPNGTISDLVAGAGRAFFRFEPQAGPPYASYIMNMPLVGNSAPTVISRLPGAAKFLTADDCHLYFADKSTLRRWRL